MCTKSKMLSCFCRTHGTTATTKSINFAKCVSPDTSGQNYVSLAGRAEISRDPTKIRELWGTPAKAWWNSPDDPNIRVITVTPIAAEYWDAPGKTAAYIKMATAAATGTRPNMGENRKVAMR
jgi:general stress protein 26